ncbi:MAG: hypothetical protein AAF558_13045 [Verrucomicrobiota bacterium]
MKDRQIRRKPETGSIPLVSPTLHVIAMPWLVVLRYDFGFQFLRPKIIFYSLIWAFLMFAIHSYFEPAKWKAQAGLFWFLAWASTMYLLHLVKVAVLQWGSAPHDQFSGRTVIKAFRGREDSFFLWGEPMIVTAVAGLAYFLPSCRWLSQYALIAAIALFLKACINAWSRVRKVKQQVDATHDAEEGMIKVVAQKEASPTQVTIIATEGTTRKKRIKRARPD